MAMRTIFLGLIVALAGVASPAIAGQYWTGRAVPYWPAHHEIYALENSIAYLEADPDVDDDFKGPVIRAHHAEIKRLQVAIAPRPPKYFTPCCYSRRPIHIR